VLSLSPKSAILVKIEAERILEPAFRCAAGRPCLLTAGRQAQLTLVNSSTVDKK